MIKLTTYDSGLDFFIDPSAITAILGCPAFQNDGQEEGVRTRIDYGDRRIALVNGSPAEIMEAIASATGVVG